ncbi:MAG: DUF6353 family protein [Ruminococcus sp.]|nr:DUF6353 family protein [Ruminococcus sp.]MCM1391780.1 DUF6353 family protein [Ruminococcus sp.]
MNKIKLSQCAKKMRVSIVQHSPEILTGIGIAGMVTTVIFAVKATPKAMKILEENTPKDEKLSAIEVVKLTWKYYIPTVISGVASIACIIGANAKNARKNMALATAYTLSESALKEYQEKVVETIGEKKEQSIRDEIAKDKIMANPVKDREVIITQKGDTLCYDILSGRYFKSDIDKIKKAENQLNRRMISEMYISLNDLYYELGIPPICVGEYIGWNINSGYLDLYFTSQLTPEHEPCLVINYNVEPKYDYQKFA